MLGIIPLICCIHTFIPQKFIRYSVFPHNAPNLRNTPIVKGRSGHA